MAAVEASLFSKSKKPMRRCGRLAGIALLLVAGLSACGSDTKEKAPGQSMARVNGEEITIHQVNEELKAANVSAEQKDAATKQLLESLIDRQLLLEQAKRDKIDRDPAVMQAIERARSQIMAQAYLQKRLLANARPSKDEIDAYFAAHPEIFAQRKEYDMLQLVIESKDYTDELKAYLPTAKSLAEVAAWLDERKLKYVGNRQARSTADMPPELVKKIQGLRKGQMFVIQEGNHHVLVALNDMRDNPMTADVAAPRIGQFLLDKKNREGAEAELKRLRAAAKIEYLNQPKAAEGKDAAAAPAATPVSAEQKKDDSHIKRGLDGL